jgi:RNA polymerase sigma factor (sigma-70 family)
VGEGVTGLRPGVREDFDRLYLATHPRLVRVLTGVLRDPAAAEDCAQEAFVRAWKAWPRWRPEAPAEAWLYRIALNVAFSYRRRLRVRQVAERLLRAGAPVGPDPQSSVNPVRQALGRLPPKEAAAVMLRHYHGYSRAEVAQILGLTERAVSLRLAKARAVLVRELGEDWAQRGLHPGAPSAVPVDEDTVG